MKKLIIYFPHILVIFLIFWPYYDIDLLQANFPIIKIGGFSVRFLEIVFIVFLLYYISLKLLYKNNVSSLWNHIYTVLRIRKAVYVIFIIILFTSILLGIYNKNPRLLLDTRGIICIAYSPLFFSCFKCYQPKEKVISKLINILFILSICNIISSIYPFMGMNNVGSISNMTMIYNLFLLCISLSLLLHRIGSSIKNTIMVLCSLYACIITLEKWMIFAVIIAIIILFFLVAPRHKKKKAGVIAFSLFLIVICSVIIEDYSNIFKLTNNMSMQDYYYSRILRNDIGDISGGRFELWEILFERISSNPLLGVGMGGDSEAIKLINRRSLSLDYIGEHNLFLWLLLRIGFIGTFIFTILLVNGFRVFVFTFKAEGDTYYKAIILGAIVFCISYLLINMVGLYFFTFESAILFWFSVGLIITFLYFQSKGAVPSP